MCLCVCRCRGCCSLSVCVCVCVTCPFFTPGAILFSSCALYADSLTASTSTLKYTPLIHTTHSHQARFYSRPSRSTPPPPPPPHLLSNVHLPFTAPIHTSHLKQAQFYFRPLLVLTSNFAVLVVCVCVCVSGVLFSVVCVCV